jgi:hypothetical protein
MDLTEYLSQPCDEKDCDRVATHNQAGRKVCNTHCDWSKPAFARND